MLKTRPQCPGCVLPLTRTLLHTGLGLWTTSPWAQKPRVPPRQPGEPMKEESHQVPPPLDSRTPGPPPFPAPIQALPPTFSLAETPGPRPPSRKVRWRPYPRSPSAFDSSGPPTQAECLGCAERRDCPPGKPAAWSLTFSEAFGPAAVALSRKHGSYSAFQRDTSQSSFHPIVTQDPHQSLARGHGSHPS